VGDVLMRWLFNATIRGMSDLTLIAVFIITALCFPICSREDGHVKITFLGAALPRFGRRILEVFGGVVTLGFLSLVAWQALQLMAEHHRAGYVTSVLEISLGPVWLVAAVALVLTALVQAVRLLAQARNREALHDTDREPH
jgi:TRAP-type transport system small permease protein